MARTTAFTFFPTPQPGLPKKASSLEMEGTLPSEYFLSRLLNNIYDFEHKFALVGDPETSQTYLQVLTKDTSGDFTVANIANRFLLSGRFLKISLIDIYDDGSEYKFRIESADMSNPLNKVVLKNDGNTKLGVAKAEYESETSLVTELNMIGSIDMRGGLAAKIGATFAAGEPFELSSENGHLIFQY